jgi:hypothetical protein
MTKQATSAQVSVAVGPGGEAAVFVTQAPAARPLAVEAKRLAEALAARGLRLAGISAVRSDGPRACNAPRVTVTSSRSLFDAVLALVDQSLYLAVA